MTGMWGWREKSGLLSVPSRFKHQSVAILFQIPWAMIQISTLQTKFFEFVSGFRNQCFDFSSIVFPFFYWPVWFLKFSRQNHEWKSRLFSLTVKTILARKARNQVMYSWKRVGRWRQSLANYEIVTLTVYYQTKNTGSAVAYFVNRTACEKFFREILFHQNEWCGRIWTICAATPKPSKTKYSICSQRCITNSPFSLQLSTSGIPEHFWKTLHEKLSQGVSFTTISKAA